MNKKLCALLVTVLMMCDLFSSSISAFAVESADGYIIKYDVASVCTEGNATSNANTQSKSFSSITYESTNGFFEYRSCFNGTNNPTWLTLMYRDSAFQMTNNRWIAFKINVPVAGAYDVSVDIAKFTNGIDVLAFILPETVSATSEQSKNTGSSYYIGRVSCYSSENSYSASKIPDFLKSETIKTGYTFAKAGTYTIMFKAVPTETLASGYAFLGTFTLSGGSNAFPMSAIATADKSEINLDTDETAQITVNSVMMSDATTDDASKYSYEYISSDRNVAEVDSMGTVTAKSVGVCEIGVRVVADGVENKYSAIPIAVTDDLMSGITLTYDMSAIAKEFQAISEPFTSITYKKTHGLFKHIANSENLEIPKTSVISYRQCGFELGSNRWIAFEIEIPKSGRYSASILNGLSTSGVDVEVYILPEGTTVTSSALTAEKRIGAPVSCLDETVEGDGRETAKNFLGVFDVENTGKYILVYKSLGPRGFPGTFILNGGNGSVPFFTDVSISRLKTATADLYMSNGDAVDLSDARVEYSSSDASIAKINSKTGKIKDVSIGSTTITAKIIISGKEYYGSAEYSVTELPDPSLEYSGVDVDYKLNLISSSWVPTQWVGAGMRIEDVRGITYEFTSPVGNGNWEYYGVSPGWSAANGTLWVYTTARMRISMQKNRWVALKVKVPKPGLYYASLEYSVFNASSGKSDIYFVPFAEEMTSDDINAKLTEATMLGTVDYLDTSISAREAREVGLASVAISSESFPTNGEYLLVFKQLNASADDHINPRVFKLEGINALAYIDCSFEDSKLTVGNSTRVLCEGFNLEEDEIDSEKLTIEYSSSNEGVASVDENGVVRGIAEGECKITVRASDGVKTKEKTLAAVVTDTSGVKSFEYEVPETLYVRGEKKLSVTANMNSGNTIALPDEAIKYSVVCNPDGAAAIEDGAILGKTEGIVHVSVAVSFKGESKEKIFDVEIKNGKVKTEPTYYTYEMRQSLQDDAKKYSWAAKKIENAKRSADKYLDLVDAMYDLIIGEGIPRCSRIGATGDPEYANCKYCGTNIYSKYGSAYGGYAMSPFSRPWKLECPECKRVFPSNDFGSLYKLGLDEQGYYDVNRAKAENQRLIDDGFFAGTRREKYGYLTNELYPEIGTQDCPVKLSGAEEALTWSVDDGWGYRPKNEDGSTQTYSNGVEKIYGYIAEYSYGTWATLDAAVSAFRDAYVYSNDAKYGIAGAKILDRIADVYPSFDAYPFKNEFYNVSGGRGTGKIKGCINDCYESRDFAFACDAFYPALNEPTLITYLCNKSSKYKLENDKSSAEKIWQNWEKGILEETFAAVKRADIYGNFGLYQNALGAAALVLDKQPESDEMIEWIFKTGGVDGRNVTGGNLSAAVMGTLDRDGMGNEASPNYNLEWVGALTGTAKVINMYGYNDLYDNPRFTKIFEAAFNVILTGDHTAQIGDTGETAGVAISGSTYNLLSAYVILREKNEGVAERVAQYIYARNGYTTDGILQSLGGLTTEDKEKIVAEIEASGKSYKGLTSNTMFGFGFMALRDGNNYASASKQTAVDNQRDFWMYFGRNIGHGHRDTLNLGIEAYGLNFAPDLGYPASTSYDPNRLQWVSTTLSHNTVLVNEHEQASHEYENKPMHFDDSDIVKLMDVSVPKAYDEVSEYRRTVVMVKASDDVSYGVDFFRVTGGDVHTYSFHSQAENAYPASGLNLTAQNGGTYAGEYTEYGEDPDTKPAWTYETKYPRGYTWLKNVRRDKSPEKQFSVEFDVEDYRDAIPEIGDLKLRVTMLNDFNLSEVAIASGPVPAKKANAAMPETLDYLLAKREGESLDSLFTTIYEPYCENQYIAGMESVSVEKKDGNPAQSDVAKAVKVTHTDGRVDYIVYATNNSVTYNVGGVFDFRGFVGVYTLNKHGNNIYRYVNDGDVIGENTNTVGSYNGMVTGFTRELVYENFIDIDIENAEPYDIVGKCIYIENDGVQNGGYKIEGAERLPNGNMRLDIDTISLIRGYIDENDFNAGYAYNIKEGKRFTIPNSFSDNKSPVFVSLNGENPNSEKDIMFTGTADKVIEVSAVVQSPIEGESVVIEGNYLPRGASFDSDTNTFKWKPDSSQVGENHVSLNAVDSNGRVTTVHFTVKVLGSTSGAGGGGGGGAGSGGGEPQTPDTPDTPDTPEQTGFTDLDGFDWAKDAINALAENGIIKGMSENTFLPGANITRADFAILLVRAFKLSGAAAENFADVLESDYFAEELAIAKESGIIGGIGDNKYAPRNAISREDMMVIVYRALKRLGFELEAGEVTAPDFEMLAPYARDAVSALMSNGLVNGKNGLIDGKANTTRAEVAVLLQRIIDYANLH